MFKALRFCHEKKKYVLEKIPFENLIKKDQ